jgi:putative ABC transport system permease protein
MVKLSTLRKKLFRDVKASKWQFTALTLLVVIGLIFFVGLGSSFQNLWTSINEPYQKLNFADFTIKVYSAPSSVVEEIRLMNGVKAGVGRINEEVPLVLTVRDSEFLTGRIITLPRDMRPAVNDIQVMEGSYFSSNGTDEVLVEKFFADYQGLKVGDKLRLKSSSIQYEYAVRGIVVSPEYLWPAKNVKDHMPTVLRTWGVLFLPEDEARRVLDLGDQINEVAILVTSQDDRDAVINDVRTVLEPYGIAEVVPRENQASDKLLHLMVGSLDVLAAVLSSFFLAVAAISTYVLLTRMVSAQSMQIGTLRALGYRRLPILLYYLSFALVVWLISAVAGLVLGQVSSIYLTNLFASRISLPIVLVEFRWGLQALGSLLALAFLFVAAVLPAWSASNLNPAEAMRPRAPKLGRVIKLDSALVFLRRVPSGWKMSLRNLSRSKRRSVSTVLGIMIATSLVVSTSSFLDSFDYLFKVMYEDIAAYDLKVTFVLPQGTSLTQAAENITGVVEVEPIIEIPYHILHGGKEFSVIITGLSTEATLYRLYTASGARTKVDPEGMLLAKLLEDKLMVEVNDSLELHLFNSTQTVRVAGFVNAPFGDSAFLSIEKAQEVTGFGSAINGLLVKTSAQDQEAVKQELFQLPSVSSIESISQQKQDNTEMLRVFSAFIWIIFVFGILMAFAVVFNTVSLNILERSRELATMRTIGIAMSKITTLVTVENALLGAIGIVLGLPLGNYLAKFFFSFFTSDLFYFEAVTYLSTYLLGIVVILTVILVSEIPWLRYAGRLNLAKVVKEQAT